MVRELLKGNVAIAEAAIRAGCQCYFGYPITPQNELTEYMANNLSRRPGCTFIQAESEIAAINMVYGGAACGKKVMTTSSSPGISLKQEGITYIAGAELPFLIVNVVRGGPGLGTIQPAQSDYFQAVKGGGHGDYKVMVFAPYSLQELWDLTMLAFDKADEYRTPVMVLGDGIVGQMMEPFSPSRYVRPDLPGKDWILDGCGSRAPRVIKSLYMGDGELEMRSNLLQKKYKAMKNREVRFESRYTDDAEVIVVAFGIVARIALASVMKLRRQGFKVGLFRPITLFPFPENELFLLSEENRRFLVVEMNAGQMVEDVKLAINGRSEVSFHGRTGGAIMTPEDVEEKVLHLMSHRPRSVESALKYRDA